jgi:membrane protein DedA with SNARE-associated domain
LPEARPVILAGSIGSLAGALLWYYIGLWLGRERIKNWSAKHGRWFTLTPDEVDQAFEFFRRHEYKAVFFGRLVPTIRTLISVPAGIAKMPLWSFLAYSAVGTALWTALLAVAGYLLESQYQRVSNWVNPVSNVVIGLIVIYYIYRVVRFDAGKKAKGSG